METVAVYKQLENGEWGLQVTGPAVVVPLSFWKVPRADGQVDRVQVERVLWAGGGRKLCKICYVEPAGPPTRAKR